MIDIPSSDAQDLDRLDQWSPTWGEFPQGEFGHLWGGGGMSNFQKQYNTCLG